MEVILLQLLHGQDQMEIISRKATTSKSKNSKLESGVISIPLLE